jgi:hypothetical protein
MRGEPPLPQPRAHHPTSDPPLRVRLGRGPACLPAYLLAARQPALDAAAGAARAQHAARAGPGHQRARQAPPPAAAGARRHAARSSRGAARSGRHRQQGAGASRGSWRHGAGRRRAGCRSSGQLGADGGARRPAAGAARPEQPGQHLLHEQRAAGALLVLVVCVGGLGGWGSGGGVGRSRWGSRLVVHAMRVWCRALQPRTPSRQPHTHPHVHARRCCSTRP